MHLACAEKEKILLIKEKTIDLLPGLLKDHKKSFEEMTDMAKIRAQVSCDYGDDIHLKVHDLFISLPGNRVTIA